MLMKRFLSGDEAFAEGVRLAQPQVISAYPITPQTVVVERLSEMVEEGQLAAEYVHVESEHSALSCAIGASATGARPGERDGGRAEKRFPYPASIFCLGGRRGVRNMDNIITAEPVVFPESATKHPGQ